MHEPGQDRFRLLLEAAPDAILEVDSGGRIVLVNAIAERMFGYDRDELLGQSIEALVPEGARGRHAGHRQGYLTQPSLRPMGTGLSLHARRRDGSLFPVEISLSPVGASDGIHVTAIIRDVSQRQAAAEELRQLQDRFTRELEDKNRLLEQRNTEVERANRLKSEFLASMSHELRSPLHTIIGFAELLAEGIEGPLNEKQQRFAQNIHQDSQHLLAIINDLLDISKIEAGRLDLRLQRFDAHEALLEVLSTIGPQAAAQSITIETGCEPETMIVADWLRFKQILLNLLSNAVKFTPSGGRIAITCLRRKDRALFTVSDTGVGIDTADHDAVFDKFYQAGSTTRGVREGTGLGLAITKRLVEEHGGLIWLDSERGGGSRFTFSVRADPPPTPRPSLAVAVTADSEAAAQAATLLESQGWQTIAFAYSATVARRVSELHPDAVILDFDSGDAAARLIEELRLQSRTANIPVIAMRPDGANLDSDRHFLLAALDSCSGRGAEPVEVLAVDDEPLALQLVGEVLRGAGYEPLLANSGKQAIDLLSSHRPAAMVVDLNMPSMSGFDLVEHVERGGRHADLPVIVLTGVEISPGDAERLRRKTAAILMKGRSWREPLLGALRRVAPSGGRR